MDILTTILIVAAGFALLVKGADLLVVGASSAAKRMQVSELIIGLTIVAIGTSTPELVVNILSSSRDYNDVVFGNIIGSNIFNTLVILGIAGTIYPMVVKHDTVWREIPFSLGITLLLFVMANDQMIFGAPFNRVGTLDGAVLALLFLAFMGYIFSRLRTEKDEQAGDVRMLTNASTVFYILGGIAGISVGGHLVVTFAVELSAYFNISEKFVGLTVISTGTSLPEFATTVVAALRRKNDIAIGNILGSNIFNITLVLGITSLINPIYYNPILNTDLYVLLMGTAMLFIFMFTLTRKKLDRWEAIILFLSSCAYLVYIFMRK